MSRKRNILFLCCLSLVAASCGTGPANNGTSDSTNVSTDITDSQRINTDLSSEADPSPGERTFEGTREDSQRTEAMPLYKGDNSDTNKRPK